MELLVVIGIITAFVGVIGYGFLRGSASSTVGLQAAQSMIVALLTQARSQAILTGRPCALFVNANKNSHSRYARFLVVAEEVATDVWRPLDVGVYLPEGCYLLGHDAPSAAEVTEGNWSSLLSDALLLQQPLQVEQTEAEQFLGVPFTARGTRGESMTQSRDLVLASGNPQPPGEEYPVRFSNPDGVRGVRISMTGQFRLLNRREDF